MTQDITWTATWTSTQTSRDGEQPGGLVTAVITGNTTIQASQNGVSASTAVMISSATVVSLSVSPGQVTLPQGGGQRDKSMSPPAHGRHDAGCHRDRHLDVEQRRGVQVTSPGGLVTSGLAGTSVVQATQSGLSAALQVRTGIISNFAYVANFNANSISGYAINSTTGALTPLSGFPKTVGTHPAGCGGIPAAPSCWWPISPTTRSGVQHCHHRRVYCRDGIAVYTGRGPGECGVRSKWAVRYVSNTGDGTRPKFVLMEQRRTDSVGGSPYAVGSGAEGNAVASTGSFAYVTNPWAAR